MQQIFTCSSASSCYLSTGRPAVATTKRNRTDPFSHWAHQGGHKILI